MWIKEGKHQVLLFLTKFCKWLPTLEVKSLKCPSLFFKLTSEVQTAFLTLEMVFKKTIFPLTPACFHYVTIRYGFWHIKYMMRLLLFIVSFLVTLHPRRLNVEFILQPGWQQLTKQLHLIKNLISIWKTYKW